MISYINHRVYSAVTGWERRSFARKWWSIFAGDSRWTPPYYPALQRELNPARNPHLARLQPDYLYIEALPVEQRPVNRFSSVPVVSPFELALATAAILYDPRRQDETAYLSLFHCANDEESLERLLDSVAETLAGKGCRRLVGPTGFSPHLESGLLLDHWHRPPPWHTPYNPPYLPELLDRSARPGRRLRLYHLPVEPGPLELAAGPAEIVPLEPGRLATGLLPLLAEASPTGNDFPSPDEAEAAFLLRWLGPQTLSGWLALVDGQPAGFALLQPDLASRLRLARGGRNLLRRLWLPLLLRLPVRQGRALYGVVRPAWRGRGIGRQLLAHCLAAARRHGWTSLSLGSVVEESQAAAWLAQQGAEARQTYQLYQWEF
ncbi:MAG: GNAT family N-acetyltransferase [Chloroflexi bacterium]|nr:GNAT family N-acetyltransferase [Chloroflexota bacterium]MCI0576603.1 GNAT family N-acetyltransferase [Chloroflexota bacterium]MCI0647029.1 GNAT family N-acetyltransferase [Chloroflexota bacterium]MCI0730729.1 GNAT family N-acetyltransferase [Chloroflexota bacterium]